VSTPFRIAYEDEHLLVVEKSAGVVVHPARGHPRGTLAQLLAGRAAGGDPQRAGIVHRLDRDTSGLLVVSRSQEVHRSLAAALAQRRIEREYLALVMGRPPARAGTIEAPIGRDPRARTRMAIRGTGRPSAAARARAGGVRGGAAARGGGREARTHFRLERALADTSLLSLWLDTGRTHQIRVHLQAIGHPLCGDREYGAAGVLGLERQFLHATRLAFEHPISGERIEVRSPLPGDLARALALAERS
jgi:23S rRNA pseudouridine1911/1915/1917 synthase